MTFFGLRVTNTSDTNQTSESSRNLEFKAKYSSATDTIYPDTALIFSYKDITITGTNPVMAVRASVWFTCRVIAQSGTTWVFRVYCYDPTRALGVPFDYYVFDAPAASSATMGLRCWNAAGEVSFDSAIKYLQASDGVNLSSGSYPDNNTYVSGRTYATIFSWTGYITEYVLIPTLFSYTDGTRYSYTVAKWTGVQMDWDMQPIEQSIVYYPRSPNYGKMLVVDVTGY